MWIYETKQFEKKEIGDIDIWLNEKSQEVKTNFTNLDVVGYVALGMVIVVTVRSWQVSV